MQRKWSGKKQLGVKESEHCEALLLGAEGLIASHNEDVCSRKKKGRGWLESQLETAPGSGNKHSTEVFLGS